MDNPEWGKIISAFIACAIKPGLVGLPTSVFAFHFTFLQTLLISGSAGICGTVFFTLLSEQVVKFYERIANKLFPNRTKRRFTKMNRFIIKAKKYFGITGIAIITPLVLSLPLGCFLAIRFFGDRKKTITYISIATVGWTVILYLVYNGFYEKLADWFN